METFFALYFPGRCAFSYSLLPSFLPFSVEPALLSSVGPVILIERGMGEKQDFVNKRSDSEGAAPDFARLARPAPDRLSFSFPPDGITDFDKFQILHLLPM